MVNIPFFISHVPPAHSFFKKKSILKNLCRICGNLFFCRLQNGRLLFSAGSMLPSLHMPAEITARSKVDISRVARLFGTQFCRSAVADNTLTIKQKSILPVSKTRQDKSLFCSLSGAYLPPLESGSCVVLLCSHLAIMDFRRTCATTIRHRFPLTPVIRSI